MAAIVVIKEVDRVWTADVNAVCQQLPAKTKSNYGFCKVFFQKSGSTVFFEHSLCLVDHLVKVSVSAMTCRPLESQKQAVNNIDIVFFILKIHVINLFSCMKSHGHVSGLQLWKDKLLRDCFYLYKPNNQSINHQHLRIVNCTLKNELHLSRRKQLNPAFMS